ncbi:MAG: hypothetical protein OCD76_20465 [Reichenbachiella sp.]
MKSLLLVFLSLFILVGCLEVQSTESVSESESSSSALKYIESVESRESSYSSKQEEMSQVSSSVDEYSSKDESSEALSSSRRSYGNTDPGGDASSTDEDASSSSKEEIEGSSVAKVERVFDESLLGDEEGYDNSDDRLYRTYKGVAQYPTCVTSTLGDLLILAKNPMLSTIESSAEEEISSSSQKRVLPWGYCFNDSDCDDFRIEMNRQWVECIGPNDSRCGMQPEYRYGPLSNCKADCDCEDGYACKTQSSCNIESSWKECKPSCEILGCSEGDVCEDKKCITPCDVDFDCTKGEFCGDSGQCESLSICEEPPA